MSLPWQLTSEDIPHPGVWNGSMGPSFRVDCGSVCHGKNDASTASCEKKMCVHENGW